MNLRSYFDKELTSTLILAIAGIIVGYVSFLINNTTTSFVLMIVIGIVVVFALKKSMKIQGEIKKWFGSGLIAYVILWLVVWTIFYNVGLR